MIRTLRPVLVASLHGRWPLPVIALVVALVLRGLAPDTFAWRSSDLQLVAGALLYGGLIPVFTIALGAAWLRGDDAPWSWAFARPVSRVRWIRATLMLDATTIAACVACTLEVLGEMPPTYTQAWYMDIERIPAYFATLVAIYAAAAFAGARGATAVGSALAVVALTAFVLLLDAVADISRGLIAPMYHFGAIEWLSRDPLSAWVYAARGVSLELPEPALMIVVAGLAATAISRVTRSIPTRPRIAQLDGLATIALVLAIAAPWVRAALISAVSDPLATQYPWP